MRKFYYLAICLLTGGLLTGCLSRPPLDRQTFLFAPPPLQAVAAPDGDRVLEMRTVRVAEPFESRAFVYRTGEFAYTYDPYAAFMVHPSELLQSSIGEWFRNSGEFRAVVESSSTFRPDTLVDIQIMQLYGDIRHADRPVAVLAVRFVFLDAPNGIPGKIILQKAYTREISLKAPTASALIEGWNAGLAQILELAARDFHSAEASMGR